MKPGGYSDSGADIAYTLRQAGIRVITPVETPNPANELDWVFADTQAGIDQALSRGARVLWLNTILFETHPIQDYLNKGLWVVGQDPDLVERFDDKWETNQFLKTQGLPIPGAVIVSSPHEASYLAERQFPLVVKPVRGRGSAGVTLVEDTGELAATLEGLFSSLLYGDALLVEDYLPGQEVTLTIMPPGVYELDGQSTRKPSHWSLPPVRRFNHQNGVAPYNGIVAVVSNSDVLSPEEMVSSSVQTLMRQCEKAAELVGARAPIRVDCRQNQVGAYWLFDVNMKPNMTGAGRPGRADQDSLSALAARRMGWGYSDLLFNMLAQAWTY